MKNYNDTMIALGFVAAFSFVMATPAFAEKVISSTTTTTVGAPVTNTTTSAHTNADGSTTTSYVTKTSQPVKTVTYTIKGDDRTKITSYLKGSQIDDGCPDGQYYYDGKCLPEMTAKSETKTYIIGKPLPTNVDLLPLPDTFVTSLTPAPEGFYYSQLNSDVLLINRADGTVVDAVSYFNN